MIPLQYDENSREEYLMRRFVILSMVAYLASPPAFALTGEQCDALVTQVLEQINGSSSQWQNTLNQLHNAKCQGSRDACALVADRKSSQRRARQPDRVEKTRSVQEVIRCPK